MRGPRAFGSPPPMSSCHRNLEPWGGRTRQYEVNCLTLQTLILHSEKRVAKQCHWGANRLLGYPLK